METKFKVSDNSGGIFARCVKVYKKRIGSIGDKVLVSITKIKFKPEVSHETKSRVVINNHMLYKAIVLTTKVGVSRNDGSYLKFNENNIILLTLATEKVIGTRINCCVLKEFRKNKKMKLLMMGRSIL